jgi:hypothetical protein
MRVLEIPEKGQKNQQVIIMIMAHQAVKIKLSEALIQISQAQVIVVEVVQAIQLQLLQIQEARFPLAQVIQVQVIQVKAQVRVLVQNLVLHQLEKEEGEI